MKKSVYRGLIAGSLLIAFSILIPWSGISQQGSLIRPTSNARGIALFIRDFEKREGRLPVSLTELKVEFDLPEKYLRYPAIVRMPKDRRKMPEEYFKLRWQYFPVSEAHPENILLAAPVPIQRKRWSFDLSRLVVRADGKVEFIPEVAYGSQIEEQRDPIEFTIPDG